MSLFGVLDFSANVPAMQKRRLLGVLRAVCVFLNVFISESIEGNIADVIDVAAVSANKAEHGDFFFSCKSHSGGRHSITINSGVAERDLL